MVSGGALDRHPEPQGARLGGRGDLGAVPRRPHERGLPPARHVRPPAAVAAAEGDPLPPGVRQLPARRDGAGRDVGDGVPERACSGATTRISRARTVTPRRRCTSCSTTSRPTCVSASPEERSRSSSPTFPHRPPDARACPRATRSFEGRVTLVTGAGRGIGARSRPGARRARRGRRRVAAHLDLDPSYVAAVVAFSGVGRRRRHHRPHHPHGRR